MIDYSSHCIVGQAKPAGFTSTRCERAYIRHVLISRSSHQFCKGIGAQVTLYPDNHDHGFAPEPNNMIGKGTGDAVEYACTMHHNSIGGEFRADAGPLGERPQAARPACGRWP